MSYWQDLGSVVAQTWIVLKSWLTSTAAPALARFISLYVLLRTNDCAYLYSAVSFHANDRRGS